MNIQLSTKNFDLTDPLRQYVEEKIGHLGRSETDSNASAHVRIGRDHHHKHGEVFMCSVHVSLSSGSLSAETRAGDAYAAVDMAQEKLERELEHAIGRSDSRQRRIARSIGKLGRMPRRQWRWIRNRFNANHDED